MRERTRRWALIAVLGVLALSSVAPITAALAQATAPVSSLEGLLARLAQVQALSARFVERKTITLMRRPLVSEGMVHFTRPGWIARWTETPERAVVLLKGGALSVRDPGGTRELDVGSNPVLRGFVEGFVHVLSGDRAALERDYALSFATSGEGWQLTLTPRSQALSKLVTRMVFVGNDARVSQMQLTEASGDHTVMDFTQVTLRQAFSAPEQQRLFSLPAL